MECIVESKRYALDLGIIAVERNPPEQQPGTNGPLRPRQPLSCRAALELAQQLHSELRTPEAPSHARLGELHGYSRQSVTSLLKLLTLPQDLQEAIRAGKADSLSYRSLLAVAWHRGAHKQRSAFDEFLRKSRARLRRKARSTARPRSLATKQHEEEKKTRLRAVLTFNPQICVEQRLKANQRLGQIHAFVSKLNQQLQTPHPNRTEASIYRLINGKLERRNLTGVFGVQLHRRDVGSQKSWEVELQFKPKVWAKQRRYDGFFLLVAEADLSQSAAELVRLYYSKDKVEKDFQSIKGLIHLRPVRHQTDPKVRAHVTLCVLALLLARTLERALADTPLHLTAAAAFDLLDNCHLNRLRMPSAVTPFYSVTELTPDQRSLLAALRLEHLGDNQVVTENILPR
jgi:hypothetical protein